MLFYFFIGLMIVAGLISAVSFVFYVRARMKEEELKEKKFQSVHYISLFIFVVLGVIILIMVSNMNL